MMAPAQWSQVMSLTSKVTMYLSNELQWSYFRPSRRVKVKHIPLAAQWKWSPLDLAMVGRSRLS
jgi:hypothetical protein